MTYTNEDALTRQWLPVARALRPAERVMQGKAISRAVTQDGYIDPIAILPGSTVVVDFDGASHTASSSDIVNYVAYLSVTIHLPPDGVWTLKARGALTGSLSTDSNMNTRVMLNSSASSNFQIPLTAGDMGTTFPHGYLAEVQGDVLLQVMFRPSAGTLTIEAGEWLYRAERIR